MASAASRAKPHLLRIFLSNKYAYAQIFRTADNQVVAAASTIEKGLATSLAEGASKSDKAACSRVGEVVAQRAREAGVDAVHWPRKHGQRYHGKIAAMIEALKAQGVKLI